MKHLIFALAMLSFSAPAIAIHAYNDETCKFTSGGAEFYVDRQLAEPDEMAYSSDFGTDVQYLNLPGYHDSKYTGHDDLALNVSREYNKVDKNYDDGCWQGKTGSFLRKVVIESISPKIASQIHHKKGDTLILDCSYETISPVGPDCNKY